MIGMCEGKIDKYQNELEKNIYSEVKPQFSTTFWKNKKNLSHKAFILSVYMKPEQSIPRYSLQKLLEFKETLP